MRPNTSYSNRQKAAILLIALGPEAAAGVYRHLRDEEIEQLTLEIAGMRRVESVERISILEEFHELAVAEEYISQGGIEYAREVLQKAVGSERALSIIERLTASLQVRPFESARRAHPVQLLNFLQNESPQTMALVLAYLEPKQAAAILSELPQSVRYDVARRIANMDAISPEVVSAVDRALENKLSAGIAVDSAAAGGIDAIVKILNGVDRTTERSILEGLELSDPDLAEEVKKRLFVFEDIVLLDSRSIQHVIRDVDQNDLQLALRTAGDEVKSAIFQNMSKRMVETFQQDMEFASPVRLHDVEAAQQRIVAQIRRLEEMGDIVIARGGGDDVLV